VQEITVDMRLGGIERRFLIHYTSKQRTKSTVFIACARPHRLRAQEDEFRKALPASPSRTTDMIWFALQKVQQDSRPLGQFRGDDDFSATRAGAYSAVGGTTAEPMAPLPVASGNAAAPSGPGADPVRPGDG